MLCANIRTLSVDLFDRSLDIRYPPTRLKQSFLEPEIKRVQFSSSVKPKFHQILEECMGERERERYLHILIDRM